MLSRLATEFAAEIANHDWSDAPFRADRAGHRRETDTNRGTEVLTAVQTDVLRTNVMWVTAQVLLHADPNLNILEYAQACGVPRRITHRRDGTPSGGLWAGIRKDLDGTIHKPGPWPPKK
jgi:hypothetical protein